MFGYRLLHMDGNITFGCIKSKKIQTTPPAHSPAGQRWGHLRGTPGRLPGTHTCMQGRTYEQKTCKKRRLWRAPGAPSEAPRAPPRRPSRPPPPSQPLPQRPRWRGRPRRRSRPRQPAPSPPNRAPGTVRRTVDASVRCTMISVSVAGIAIFGRVCGGV